MSSGTLNPSKFLYHTIPGVWRITPSTIFRLAACRQWNNSNIARPR